MSSFKLSESATGVPSGSTAHLLLLQKPEKEQATKFEVLSTCPADEQPAPQLESDTEDPELKGLASLAECKSCPGCGAKADFLECEFCGAWMCVQCLGEHIWLNHVQAERLREHIRRDRFWESHLQHTCSTPSSPAAICVSNLDAETSFEPIPSAAMASGMSNFQLTKPSSLESIDSGMTIRFIKVNGEPAKESDFGIPSEWMTNSCETVDAIRTSVARLITKHLAVPN